MPWAPTAVGQFVSQGTQVPSEDDSHPERSGLLKKTKLAIESLQEELSQAKNENERLRKSGELKARQFKELQSQLDEQQNRLQSLDGRLVQGQSALTAACAASQSREVEFTALRQLNASKDRIVQDQASTVARLERRVAEGDAVSAALKDKEESMHKTLQELQKRLGEAEEELREERVASEQLRGRLEDAQTVLAQERARADRLDAQHAQQAVTETQWEEKLSHCAQEWKLRLERERASALAESRLASHGAGEAAARQWADILEKERASWVAERARLLNDCHQRLEYAEQWLEIAARDSEAQREHSEAAARETTARMQQMEL